VTRRLCILLVLAASGLGALVWLNWAPPSGERAARQQIDAAALVERGDLDAGIARFNALILTDPANARLYGGLGHAYLLRNNYGQALQPLEAAWGMDPNLPHIDCELADVYVHVRDRDAALRALERARAKSPGCPHAQLVAAEQSLRDDDLTKALAGFQEAIRAAPHLALAYQRAGYTLHEMDRREEAEKVLLQGLGVAPGDAGIHLQLGRLYAAQPGKSGALAKAEEHYRSALENNPNPAEVYSSLGKTAQLQGHLKDAREYWTMALRINRNEGTALYGLAQLLLADKKKDEARLLLERHRMVQGFQREITELRAKAAMQGDPAVRLRLARLSIDAGHADEAERQLSVLVRERPEDPRVRALNGELLMLQQRPDEAKLEFRLANGLP